MNENNVNNGLSWIERTLNIVDKYKITTIFKALFLIIIICGTVSFIQNPTYIFEKYKKWEDTQHSIALEKRMKNNAEIQLLIEKLLYKTNAKRVVVLELHNGLTSNGNLPFAKCTATYEALKDGVHPISDQYQNTNLSLMPFANELFKQQYWCGDTQDFKDIDKALYYKMMANGTEHIACCVIKGVNEPLAFLFVSFEATSEAHSCNDVHNIINDCSLQLSLLMELKKQ